MKELVEVIVKALVDHPDDVQIKENTNGNKIRLTLTVNQDDMGKVIGRHGRIAKAIRTVLKAYATKEDVYVDLDIE
ncbi:MAG: KH domain-containing protein [Anaerofustis stercorihominis]|nr:KH domain-containing protein [Anaerofustis stercorihominis]